MSIYDITVNDWQGNPVSLSQYKGKVLLIVNTATGCGFTPQYAGLQTLYEKYRSRGFEVLDFPSNQFLGQAPGTDAEIYDFCTLHYNTTFSRFQKTRVNGRYASPLFQFLKEKRSNVKGGVIKWNFTKFLIDREGNVAKRFEPIVVPEALEKDVAALL
jgi:glutathione peroxidase